MVSVEKLPLESLVGSPTLGLAPSSAPPPPSSLPEWFALTLCTSDGTIVTCCCDSLEVWQMLKSYISDNPENCRAFLESRKCGKMSGELRRLCRASGVEMMQGVN